MPSLTGPTPERWRIDLAAPGQNPTAWAYALATFDPATATPLKREGDDATMLARMMGREVVLKRWALNSAWARLRHALRLSRAWRQWRGSVLLNAAGIPAARGLLIARADGAAWLVLERVPGLSLLHHIAGRVEPALPARAEHGLARAVGQLVLAHRVARVFNRDGKPSNIIVAPPGAPLPGADGTAPAHRPVVIDTVGVRAAWPRGGLITMLKNLCMEPLGHGCLPRRALLARVVATVEPGPRAARRALWRAVARAVRAHGDPTPRVDILSVDSRAT